MSTTRVGRVLYATDFSKASEPAERLAVQAARALGAKLHVIHVVPPVTDASLAAERLRAAAARLTDAAPETALLDGNAGRQIVSYARAKGVDLIVLGTHGRTGVSRALLGSVAERVVRTAPCPVLTVPLTPASPGPAQPGAAVEGETPGEHPCVVCGTRTEELICETCRNRIRAEALDQKIQAERAGHRGLPR